MVRWKALLAAVPLGLALGLAGPVHAQPKEKEPPAEPAKAPPPPPERRAEPPARPAERPAEPPPRTRPFVDRDGDGLHDGAEQRFRYHGKHRGKHGRHGGPERGHHGMPGRPGRGGHHR